MPPFGDLFGSIIHLAGPSWNNRVPGKVYESWRDGLCFSSIPKRLLTLRWVPLK